MLLLKCSYPVCAVPRKKWSGPNLPRKKWSGPNLPGKVKIADMLGRAGIHIGKTTVGRILNENLVKPPDPTTDDAPKQCKIVSKYPGHTWNADLTAVPISGGF